MSSLDPRELAIEAVLRAQPSTSAPSSECLDAETLAAWVDGTLGDTSVRTAEAHMASCARCQSVMAALLSAPPISPVVSTGGEAPGTPWWHLDLRWLMPLAGALAALLIWVVVPRERETPAVPPESDVAMSRPPESAAPIAPPAGERSSVRPEARGFEPPPAETQKAGAAQEKAPDAVAGARAESAAAPKAETPLAKGAPAPLAATPPAAAGSEAAAAPAAASPAPARSAESDVDLRRNRVADLGIAQSAGGGIVSRDPSVQWRLAGGGVIERSVDGGVSWTGGDTGVPAGLAAGSAPSATVCWVVGRAGLVLLTTDARTWRQLPAPTADDLVSVEATNDRQARVRTAAGETFQTTDAGATWVRHD